MTILSIISIPIPGVASLLLKALLNLIYFDLLYTEEWINKFMSNIGFDFNIEDDRPINAYFEDFGFESR
jgi:hypothetical protein